MSWNNVCKSKYNGGISVKNIEIFNRGIMCKWKWRILMEEEALWGGILKHRYGNLALKMFTNEDSRGRSRESIWRRDIE